MAGRMKERATDDLEENHEINVTPFIDVMLVLLIIFMVAAPLATVDVKVDLPASSAKKQERPDKPLYLTLTSELALSLGNDPVTREGLAVAMQTASEGNLETRVFLRADKTVAYEHLMEVMNLLRDAGYLKIALVGLEGSSPAPAAPEPKAEQQP
ncbi:TonB system transport protein ExbD [Nitratireductor aquibiodomus]|uniref:TonB system transport protein ExbD n=1 Tax=Nitratireductor aquibiodomus TaxID=204799 RepID=UPI0004684836|nr:TonB system transport protein ExbD [Nitratireductor aquibiodomus]